MFFFRKKFPSAEAIEKEEKQKIKLYQEFIETQNSGVLKEYFQLHDELHSPTFKVEKEKLTNLNYKKSENYNKEQEFEKLEKNSDIQQYFALTDSKELKEYLKFKDSEEYKHIFDAAERKKSEKLNNFYKFENSKPYKVYKELNNSPVLKRYTELKAFLESEKHIQFKAQCNDPKFWEKTDLYKKEVRFNELVKQDNVANYLKYKESDFFAEQKKWELSFVDEFNTGQLEAEKWLTSYFWVKDFGKDMYTSQGEYQAYRHADNLSVANENLTISTKKETGKGKFWDPAKGFVEKETPYTSGLICSINGFDYESGMLKIKFKLSGNNLVNHSAWLGTSNNDQTIVLFKSMKKRFMVGTLRKKGKNINKAVQLIKKISLFSAYHILTLEWDENTITWKVNDSEIKSVKNDLRNAPMHLVLNSTVSDLKKSGNSELIVDWVRSYSRKKATA